MRGEFLMKGLDSKMVFPAAVSDDAEQKCVTVVGSC